MPASALSQTCADRPNILVIMSDQHRGDCLGIEEHPVLLTPALDSLAVSGVRFARAYSPCPVCIPARRSFMSGQFPATHGMVAYADNCPWYPQATLPGELRKAGYHTCLVGRSMHLHPSRKRFGFDHMVHTGDVHPDDVHDPLPAHGVDPAWSHGLTPNGSTAHPWHMDEALHPSNRTVDAAIRFLQRRDPSCPFFLVTSFAAPHPPLYPPQFYFDRYVRTGVPSPTIGSWESRPANNGKGLPIDSHDCVLEGEALLSCRAGYYGLINHIDDQIQRLLNPATGMDRATRRNTIILYTSDHGEMLGDHYLFRKSSPYEGAARIPLIVSAPGFPGLSTGSVCNAAVSLEDLMPTILEMAGVPVPSSVDGCSLLGLLRGESDVPEREFVHIECVRSLNESFHSLTNGQQKYIWWSRSGDEQLFDLANDPGEKCDLSTDPRSAASLELWRCRLAKKLEGRPEGFSDGARLVSQREILATLPHVSEQRSADRLV